MGAAASDGSAAAFCHISSLADVLDTGAAACPLADIRGPINGGKGHPSVKAPRLELKLADQRKCTMKRCRAFASAGLGTEE